MKKLSSLFFWLFFLFYMELVLKFALFNDVLSFNLLYMFIFLIPIALILHIITTLFGNKINKLLDYLLLFIITIIFCAQLVYYKTFLSVFSFYSMAKGTEQILEFADTIVKIVIRNSLSIILFLIPFILFIIFNKRFMSYKRGPLKYYVVLIIGAVILQVLGDLSLLLAKKEMYSVKDLYYNTNSPTLSTNKLGLLTTMRLDLKRLIFGFKEKSELVIKHDDKPKEKPDEKLEYNTMNIDFDALIASENDATIVNMNNYFKNVLPTNKNKYTGIFKGKNLITVLGESFNSLAIDKDLTPTLYKMVNEGFKFTNFYTPLFPVSTSDGEYMTTTSLIPKEGVWSAYRSSTNYLPFVLGNAFKAVGYKTIAYHNNTATYYKRNYSVPNLGYDNFYACKKGLNINCKQWPESDLEMVNASYNQYINNTPFLTYYITVSGHLRYNKYNSMALKNWSYVKDLPYSDAIKAYLSCNIELDKAMEQLIKYLDEKGILDDTVIQISGDHYPYGLTLDEMNEKSEPKRDANFDIHKSSLVIWNSAFAKTNTITVNKLSSSLDVLPTLLNLFGIEYDSRLLMGKDIFSNAEPMVIFSNRSFITNKGRYNSITKTFEGNNTKVEQSYIDEISQKIYDEFYLSKQMLEKDYYKHVFK